MSMDYHGGCRSVYAWFYEDACKTAMEGDEQKKAKCIPMKFRKVKEQN